MTKAALLYDGACPLCQNAADWAQDHARPGLLETLACQSPARAERFPHVPQERCMEAMLLILPDGTAHAGHEALPHLFRLMRRWQWLARVFALPGIALMAGPAYRFVARHRHVISVFVARKHEVNQKPCRGPRPDSWY